jgi:hypothetical protein
MEALIVFRSIWKKKVWTFHGGGRVDFKSIDEAREYAKQHEYKKIQIRYV